MPCDVTAHQHAMRRIAEEGIRAGLAAELFIIAFKEPWFVLRVANNTIASKDASKVVSPEAMAAAVTRALRHFHGESMGVAESTQRAILARQYGLRRFGVTAFLKKLGFIEEVDSSDDDADVIDPCDKRIRVHSNPLALYEYWEHWTGFADDNTFPTGVASPKRMIEFCAGPLSAVLSARFPVRGGYCVPHAIRKLLMGWEHREFAGVTTKQWKNFWRNAKASDIAACFPDIKASGYQY